MLRLDTLTLPQFSSRALQSWILAILGVFAASWLLIHGHFSLLVFFSFLMALVIATALNKPLSICLIFIYLFMLGDIRRIVGTFLGFPRLDPLLLVGPLVTILLAVPLLLRLRLSDPISKAMIGLMAVMAFETVNPRQGPITVGLAGAMFWLVPVLWFWIGRQYGTDALLYRVIYRVVLPLSVLASLLGIWQTYVGFLPWEQAWVTAVESHYTALYLTGGFIRAFGFSVNSVEYANLQLIGCTSVLTAFLSGRRVYGLLFPLLAFTLFLCSARGAVVKLIFAVAVAWALSSRGSRWWVLRLVFALVVGFGLLVYSLSHVASSVTNGKVNSAADAATQHEVQGLANPLNSKYSTAGAHAGYFMDGIRAGFRYPIGEGLGAVTIGNKLGGGESSSLMGSTEFDISDAFVAMGVVGGLLYLATIFLIVGKSIQFAQNAPKSVGLPALALLAALGGTWVAIGQYAIGPLVWFVIGSVARSREPSAVRVRRNTTAASRIPLPGMGAIPT